MQQNFYMNNNMQYYNGPQDFNYQVNDPYHRQMMNYGYPYNMNNYYYQPMYPNNRQQQNFTQKPPKDPEHQKNTNQISHKKERKQEEQPTPDPRFTPE
jgi:hypothetical protein